MAAEHAAMMEAQRHEAERMAAERAEAERAGIERAAAEERAARADEETRDEAHRISDEEVSRQLQRQSEDPLPVIYKSSAPADAPKVQAPPDDQPEPEMPKKRKGWCSRG